MSRHPLPSVDSPPPVTDNLIDRIARDLGRDKQSVMRRLLNLPVRGQAGTQIDQRLAALGLAPRVSVLVTKNSEGDGADDGEGQ